VRAIRAARAENGVAAGKRIAASISAGELAPFYGAQREVLAFLARLDEEKLVVETAVAPPDQAVTIAQGALSCYLPLAGMVDLDKERERLSKEIADLEKEIKRVTGLLNSPFAEKAPPPVVQKERDKLEKLQAGFAELQARLESMG
jgi:valyl-tRNA synthetase